MRFIILFLLIVTSILLQSTIFNYLQVAGVKPNLVLILVVVYSLIKGSRGGATFGFFAGLLIDITIGNFIGLNAFALLLVGYCVGFAEGILYKENWIIPTLAVFSASLFNEFLLYLLHSGIGFEGGFFQAFVQNIFPMAIYNTALIPILYSPLYNSITKGLFKNKN